MGISNAMTSINETAGSERITPWRGNPGRIPAN